MAFARARFAPGRRTFFSARRVLWRRVTPTPTRASAATPPTRSGAAIVGRRGPHFAPRSQGPTRRARIGSPSRNRRRSSASASADAYRFAGSFCRHFSAIVSASRGSARHQPRRRHRLGRLDLLERLQDRRPPERRAADQELVQDRPQGVDVGERADLLGLALGLLRGHVAGRAQDRLGRRQARLGVQDSWPGRSRRPWACRRRRSGCWTASGRGGRSPAGAPRRRRGPAPRPASPPAAPARGCRRAAGPGCRPRRIPARGRAGRRPRRCGGSGRCWGAGAWRRPRPRRGSGRRRRGRRGRRPGSPSGAGAVQADLPRPVDDPHGAAAELALDLVAGDGRRGAVGRGGVGLVGVRRVPDPGRGDGGLGARVTPPVAWPGSTSPARVDPSVSGGPFGPRSATVASGSDPPAPIVSRSRGCGSPMRAPCPRGGSGSTRFEDCQPDQPTLRHLALVSKGLLPRHASDKKRV